MSGPPMIPAEVEDRIVERYEQGESMQRVADLEFVGLTTVWRVLSRRGVKSRSRARPQLAHSEYIRTIELYQSGYGSEDVGRLLGVTGAAVRQRLRLAGVPRRKGGTPPRRLEGGW